MRVKWPAGACALLALLATAAVAAEPRPRQRVLRTWSDTIKTERGDVARRVEEVFDYARGVAYENAYDASGKPLSSVTLQRQPRPSAEEIEEANGIVRADPSIGRNLARTGAVLHGAFLLEEAEGRACGPRARCLQVLITSPDGRGMVRRVVVDLTKGAIAYRAFVPSVEYAK